MIARLSHYEYELSHAGRSDVAGNPALGGRCPASSTCHLFATQKRTRLSQSAPIRRAGCLPVGGSDAKAAMAAAHGARRRMCSPAFVLRVKFLADARPNRPRWWRPGRRSTRCSPGQAHRRNMLYDSQIRDREHTDAPRVPEAGFTFALAARDPGH